MQASPGVICDSLLNESIQSSGDLLVGHSTTEQHISISSPSRQLRTHGLVMTSWLGYKPIQVIGALERNERYLQDGRLLNVLAQSPCCCKRCMWVFLWFPVSLFVPYSFVCFRKRCFAETSEPLCGPLDIVLWEWWVSGWKASRLFVFEAVLSSFPARVCVCVCVCSSAMSPLTRCLLFYGRSEYTGQRDGVREHRDREGRGSQDAMLRAILVRVERRGLITTRSVKTELKWMWMY